MSGSKTEDEIKRAEEAKRANTERNNERLERLNAIANSADENREMEDVPDDEVTDWSDPDAEETTAEAAPDAEPGDIEEARSHGADDVRETNGERYYRLIVNGQERWLTLQQLRDTASKVSAADEYLRNAKQAAQNVITAPSRQDEPQPARSGVRDMLQRALMGEHDAVDELTRLLEAVPSNQDVLRSVDERVDGRLTFRQAVDWFNAEYADVLKIDAVHARAVQMDAELAAANPNMDFKARLKLVGDDARQYLQQLRSQLGAVGQNEAMKQKEARKASVRSLPAAGGRPAVDDDENDDETHASAIAKMASARGQSRPIIHRRS